MGFLGVRQQYDLFPYPRFPWWRAFFLPGPRQLQRLVVRAAQDILVAGCGTLQATLLARAHPSARIEAVDISPVTLRKARRLARFAGVAPRIRFSAVDLQKTSLPADFDYVVCTGVLHHCGDPFTALQNLARALRLGGALRLMTYAPHSRMWVYAIQRWLREQKISSVREARKALRKLPSTHPFSFALRTYSDARSAAGFVDGFLHAHDRPISYLELEEWTRLCGLSLERVDMPAPTPALAQKLSALPPWRRLAVLDDLTELSTNPALVLKKTAEPVAGVWLENKTAPKSLAEGVASALRLLGARTPEEQKDWIDFLSRTLRSYEGYRGAEPFTAGDFLRPASVPSRVGNVATLKAELSHYLEIAENGEQVLVTSHGKEIAKIGPAATDHVPPVDWDAFLKEHPPIKTKIKGTAAAALIRKIRDEE